MIEAPSRHQKNVQDKARHRDQHDKHHADGDHGRSSALRFALVIQLKCCRLRIKLLLLIRCPSGVPLLRKLFRRLRSARPSPPAAGQRNARIPATVRVELIRDGLPPPPTVLNSDCASGGILDDGNAGKRASSRMRSACRLRPLRQHGPAQASIRSLNSRPPHNGSDW